MTGLSSKIGILAVMVTNSVFFLMVKDVLPGFLVRSTEEQIIISSRRSNRNNSYELDRNLTLSTMDEAMMTDRPPLSSLIDGDTIIGDVDFLVDFAIIGHAKTATTQLHNWLRKQPSIHLYWEEIHALTKHEPANMVKLMYELPPDGLHGYKAPRDIVDPTTLDLLAQYFPSARLIVGLRHPISWFQSLYNFMEFHYTDLPPAEKLLGECQQDLTPSEREIARKEVGGNDWGVCTELARFHVHLSLLGKTNVSDPRQDKLLGPRRFKLAKDAPIRNKVFLYESSQLDDLQNSTRFELFKNQLENFIGLKEPMGPPPKRKASNRSNSLDICEPKYAELRAELLRHGIAASTWIFDYFMDLPDVVVSSPEYFRELLLKWQADPCTQEQQQKYVSLRTRNGTSSSIAFE